MGYTETGHGAKGRKVWLFDDDDVKQMYKCNQKILLWCCTEETRKKTVQKQTSSDKVKVSGRTSNYKSRLNRLEEVEGLCQQLKEKHGSKYKPEQIRTWAHVSCWDAWHTGGIPWQVVFLWSGLKKTLRSIKYHFTWKEESCFRIPVTRQASERP